MAAQNPLTQTDRPHQLFADAPPVPQLMSLPTDIPQGMPGMPMMPPSMQTPGRPIFISYQIFYTENPPAYKYQFNSVQFHSQHTTLIQGYKLLFTEPPKKSNAYINLYDIGCH